MEIVSSVYIRETLCIREDDDTSNTILPEIATY